MRDFSKDQAAAYLAGIIDGEGCIYYRRCILPNGKNHQCRLVTIANTDPAIIDAVAACMDVLGIRYSCTERAGATSNRKRCYIIDVRRGPDMWRLRATVPIVAPNKRLRLDEALASYRGLHCKGCGCLHDEYTGGCYNCRKRHYFRTRVKRSAQGTPV